MRNNALINSFTDLDPISHLFPPHVVIKAADVGSVWGDDALIHEPADLWMAQPPRLVVYEDADGNKFEVELTPYVHPTGAADLVLGVIAYAADGTATYTPNFEGRFITEPGVLVPTAGAPQDAIDVAGLLFTDYFTHFTDNAKQLETFRVHTIEEGDFLWLIRRGDWEPEVVGQVNDGDFLVSDGATAGRCVAAPAVNTGGTIANFYDTFIQHVIGQPECKALAQAKDSVPGPGVDNVRAWIDLPPRFSR